jgi:hypothetical protein
MPSTKQINYIMMLLSQRGFSTRFMSSDFKALGATMKQRSGSVQGWVESLNGAEASALIDKLKSMPAK